MDLLCLDFVNSDWRDYRGTGRSEDRLLQRAWRDGFLQRWDLGPLPDPDEATLADLHALRDELLDLLERLSAGDRPAAADLRLLNASLSAAPVRRVFSSTAAGYRVEEVPMEPGWRWVASAISASCVELLTRHEPARVKFCENPDCRWAFYDESRPRSRRWCADACGSLIKVRRFRARRRQDSAQPSAAAE